jgi:sulfatase maturation enzyme AslB (radical SAM superfamily)
MRLAIVASRARQEGQMIDDRVRSLVVPHIEEGLYVMPSTICNLSCRFCGLAKSSMPGQVMAKETFLTVIGKACEYGFRYFNLTPVIGEPLTDPKLTEKMELLEKKAGVQAFCLCTNMTLADARFLDLCRNLARLRWLSISLYGHDVDSFRKITRKGPDTYFRILENLRYVTRWPDFVASRVEIRMRTEAGVGEERYEHELRRLLDLFRAAGGRIRYAGDEDWFDTWGGLVSREDLEGLDIRLSRPRLKKAPCSYLFRKHTVWPDGRLSACSRTDVNGTMIIGDLLQQIFEQIYSHQNGPWAGLISAQLAQRFPAICQNCTAYRESAEGG